MSAGSDAALMEIFGKIKDIPVGERADFLEMLLCAGIGIMRGAAGDEFTRGFLESALADLDKPSTTFVASRSH